MYLNNEFLMKFIDDMNTMSCPIIFNSNTMELTMHTSCYWVLDLLCASTDNKQFHFLKTLHTPRSVLKSFMFIDVGVSHFDQIN